VPSNLVKKLLPGLCLSVVVLLVFGWLAFSSAQRAGEMRRAGDEVDGALRTLSRLAASISEFEGSARGLLAAGDDASRLRFQSASASVQRCVEALGGVNDPQAEFTEAIERLRTRIGEELAAFSAIAAKSPAAGAVERLAEHGQRAGLTAIRQELEALEQAEARELYASEQRAEAAQRRAAIFAGLAAGLPLLLGIGAVWLGLRGPRTAARPAESAPLDAAVVSRRVIEAAGDWVCVLEPDSTIVSMNAEGCRSMEVSDVRTMIGKMWLGLWRGEAATPAKTALAEARAGNVGSFTALCPSANDSPRWWSVLVKPVLNGTGACEKLLAVARDITAGRQAEDKFRALFQRSIDAHCILDDRGIFECNDAAVRGLGFSKSEELLGQRLEQISPDTQADGKRSGQKIAEAIQLARRAGHCRFAWTFRRAGGQNLPAEVSLTPIELDGRKALFAVWRDLSERQQAETALRESESRFQQFMEHSPFAAFIKDDAGKLVYVNRKFEQGFGRKSAEVLGRPAFDWLPADTVRKLAESDQSVLTSGQAAEVVETVPQADGRMREWLLMKFPIKSESGRTLLGGVGMDVTDRRGSERQLQQSESQFRDLFDDAPVAYHELDLKNRITRVNKTELTLLGYTAEEMVGRLVWDFIVEDRHDTEQGAGDSGIDAYQRTFRRKDGKTIPVLMRHKLIKDASGLICGMRSTLQDISALKRKEEQLLEAEEKYRSIFENAVEGIFQSTGEGAYINANPALAQIFGYDSPDDVMCSVTNVGRQLYVDPQRRAAFVATMNEKGFVNDFQSEIRRKDGSRIWISERARAVRDKDGKLLYYEGTVQDVTARREADAAITEARDAALESARLKTEFLANMSHEIRTPMNGVIGMTGLLLDTDLQPKQREFAETITSSAESLVAIINDILDFSKIEAGMLTFEEIDFQLHTAVEAGVELLAERAAAKELELASLIRGDVPAALRGDPGRLRQVITNLVGNAVKFTDRGEVYVEARKVDEDADSVRVRFSVRDTGVGISKEAQGKLFQAFVQADGSTTRKFGGTGLGLAICKQLVRQMDGEIGVESELGKGATFWFTARFLKQPEARPIAIPQIELLRRSRILVVDDQPTSRSVIHHLLEAAGIREELAVSGAEALVAVRSAAAKNQPFDAVLIDMQMPEMDGMALARAIKADRRVAHTPLVMMTCRDRRDDPEAMRDVGIDAYVTKPLKRAALFDCLRSALSDDDAGVSMDATLVALKRAPAAAAPMAGLALRILVAEDNEVNQKVALHQLKKLGFAAEAVANGNAALAALRQRDYDLVFMDCQMPELDGYEATARLRQIEGGKRHTWVVAMTANTLEGDREKCIASGMDDYVAKPVKTNDMLAALNRYVQRTDAAPAVAAAALADAPAALTPAVDPAALASFREMDDGEGRVLDQLISAFLDNTPKVLAEAHRALEQKAALQVARCAHSLKGSCGNFGASAMWEACQRLEKLAGTGTVSGAPELLSQIESEFARVRAALEHERSLAAV
jgi:two-component system, sensor histidine kinase and response regulator